MWEMAVTKGDTTDDDALVTRVMSTLQTERTVVSVDDVERQIDLL